MYLFDYLPQLCWLQFADQKKSSVSKVFILMKEPKISKSFTDKMNKLKNFHKIWFDDIRILYLPHNGWVSSEFLAAHNKNEYLKKKKKERKPSTKPNKSLLYEMKLKRKIVFFFFLHWEKIKIGICFICCCLKKNIFFFVH